MANVRFLSESGLFGVIEKLSDVGGRDRPRRVKLDVEESFMSKEGTEK
jgi:hypothetical protein